METPFSGGAFKPEELYAASAERFFELLKSFIPSAPAASAAQRDWSQLAGPLAAQFEQWLRMSQSAGPWFAAPAGVTAGMGPAAAAAPGWSFGPLPLGPAAVPRAETQRVFELVARLTQLQAQLAAHWGEIARSAAQRFVARAGAPAAMPSLDQTLKLYELWVACAEEAYAATARGEDFSRLQGELANASAALLVEQRRHAEGLVRAFGLPTRNEVDALYAHVKDLGRRLADLESRAPGSPRAPRAAAAGKKRSRAATRRAAPKRGRRS
jgi:hypothetical protein